MKSGPWTAPSEPACSTHAGDLFTATHERQAPKRSFLKHSAPGHATVKASRTRIGRHGRRSRSENVIAGVQVKMRGLLQRTVSRLARVTGLPQVVMEETEVVLGSPRPSRKTAEPHEADSTAPELVSLGNTMKRQTVLESWPASPSKDPGRATDMNASVDTLAEQMLTLVEIVSAQEADIKALKEQGRKLEEHDQAIAVAFSTFFHVLSAGRVAKLSEIAGILNHIIEIAEQEGRPQGSIKFLRDLASLIPEDQR